MLVIVPAYDRRYENIDEALKDWEEGKDFKIDGGPYCSIRDLDVMVRDFDRVTLYVGNAQHILGQNIWGEVL